MYNVCVSECVCAEARVSEANGHERKSQHRLPSSHDAHNIAVVSERTMIGQLSNRSANDLHQFPIYNRNKLFDNNRVQFIYL